MTKTRGREEVRVNEALAMRYKVSSEAEGRTFRLVDCDVIIQSDSLMSYICRFISFLVLFLCFLCITFPRYFRIKKEPFFFTCLNGI